VNRSQKEALVERLQRTLSDASILVVTRQTGLTVAEVDQLRRRMRAANAGFKVTKNRLARIALQGTKFEGVSPLFKGPTGLAYSVDPVAAAKVAVDFAKSNEKLTVVGGVLAGQVLDQAGIQALATLPSLDELRGRIVGLLQAPATKVARVLQAPASQLARVLAAYAEKDAA
jgi:large subunit ribosomal protein L10